MPDREPDYVLANDVLSSLGRMEFVMRPLTNVFPDKYPYLGEGIRYHGSYDDPDTMEIHPDDVMEYASRYIDWNNQDEALSVSKDDILRGIKRKLED